MEKIKRPPLTPREQELFNWLLRYQHKKIPSQSALASIFCVHQTRISQLIARLTMKGYISKKNMEIVKDGNGR